jgi:predicted RNA-binding Zn ribbon-like protein
MEVIYNLLGRQGGYATGVAQASSAAPGKLELVRRFVNTRNVETKEDDLGTPSSLASWLREVGLSDGQQPIDTSDLGHAVDLREAIRELLLANQGGGPAPAKAVGILTDAAGRAGLRISFDGDGGWTASPTSSGVDRAIGKLLAIMMTAMTEGTWRRLKVCVNDECRWAFYDRSRGRSAKWCSMGVCGNRMKQRTWRVKHPSG